jgi:hypothetical protein
LSALVKLRLVVPMLAIVACFALAGPIIATASANNNSIIGVINRWSPIVRHDENALLASQTAYQRNRKARPLVAAYRHEVSDLQSFASQLKHQSASTRIGAEGRDDVTTGLLQIATAYQRFASELKKAGSIGLSKKQISANTKIQLAGHDKIVAGFKLLKML